MSPYGHYEIWYDCDEEMDAEILCTAELIYYCYHKLDHSITDLKLCNGFIPENAWKIFYRNLSNTLDQRYMG